MVLQILWELVAVFLIYGYLLDTSKFQFSHHIDNIITNRNMAQRWIDSSRLMQKVVSSKSHDITHKQMCGRAIKPSFSFSSSRSGLEAPQRDSSLLLLRLTQWNEVSMVVTNAEKETHALIYTASFQILLQCHTGSGDLDMCRHLECLERHRVIKYDRRRGSRVNIPLFSFTVQVWVQQFKEERALPASRGCFSLPDAR